METSRLTRGEWLTGGAGVGLFVTMFLPWFGTAPEENPFIPPARQVTVNAWRSFEVVDFLILATVLAAVGFAVLIARGADPIRAAQLRLAAAGLSIVTVIVIGYRMVSPLENTTLRFGIVLGMLAALAVLAGTQLSILDERGYQPRTRPPVV
jgi:hypothetical protein